jgi:tetratricopeptide (TPR) repeat protein
VGKSVTVCSLTTIAGFAALIPASHRGISSLGWTLAIGVTLVFIATMIVLPALFELFGRRQDDLRRSGDAHGAPPHRQRASGVTLVVLCTAAVLAATGIAHAAGTNSAARETSNRIVAEAETMIIEAGRTNPPDSAKLYSAVRKLVQATEVDPTNDAAYIDLGFCYGALRDRETAIEMYEKAVKLNPSADNYRELANVYLRAGDAMHALMAANAGLAKNPDNASLYNAKGMALHDQTRFDEAIEAFKLALKYDPNFAVARANLELLVARTRETGKSPAKGGD